RTAARSGSQRADPFGFYEPLGGRRHPADACAAGLGEDGDAADAGHVEDRPHELGAGRLCFLHTGIDVVNGEIGHPRFGHLGELGAIGRKYSGDRLAVDFSDPIGRAILHRHRREAPADRRCVELLGALGVARKQFVPVEVSMIRHLKDLRYCASKNLASFSSVPVQPARWRSRAGSSKNCSWIKVSSAPSPSGLMKTFTSDWRSGMVRHIQVNTSFSFGTTS